MNKPETLFHYTSEDRFQKIMEKGKIVLSPSCLFRYKKLEPVFNQETGMWTHSDLEHDHIKPVVWLTDSKDADRHGLYGKGTIRITVKTNDSVAWWLDWQKRNRMNKFMFKTLTAGTNYGSWWVSEKEIPVSDILLAEDVITGEVIYSADNVKVA